LRSPTWPQFAGLIGECNVVQTSQYATIVGIPVAVLGLIFYLATLALWAVQRSADW
jgi:uncharacterized membrane protein